MSNLAGFYLLLVAAASHGNAHADHRPAQSCGTASAASSKVPRLAAHRANASSSADCEYAARAARRRTREG
jgi:hypothetical protein